MRVAIYGPQTIKVDSESVDAVHEKLVFINAQRASLRRPPLTLAAAARIILKNAQIIPDSVFLETGT